MLLYPTILVIFSDVSRCKTFLAPPASSISLFKSTSPTFSPTSALLKSIPSVDNFILLLLSSPSLFFTYSFAGLPKLSKPSSSFELSSATFLSCLPSKASFPCDISSAITPHRLPVSFILFIFIGINTFLCTHIKKFLFNK